jgi:hypothetical protein
MEETMENKIEILNRLNTTYRQWLELIASLSEEHFQEPLLHSDWSIKDIIAHLWSWQQASVARADAALKGGAPDYPEWWKACGPDPEEDVDRTNAYLYAANKNKDWSTVYNNWKDQFQHYLELLEQIPEINLLQEGRFTWMGNYALAASVIGSCEHHEEHYETLTHWLKEQ